MFENGTCRWGQGGFSGSRKEKDPEGIGRTGFGEGIESVKDGVYWKTSIDNLFLGSFCSIRDFLVSLSVTSQKSVGAFRQEAFILMESVTIVITGLRGPPDLT